MCSSDLGGTPAQQPLCYAVRSPLALVPTATALPRQLQLWYSPSDPVVGEPRQAPAFIAALAARRLPGGFVVRTGTWGHGSPWNRDLYAAALGLHPTG